MFYRKNLPVWERVVRGMMGLGMAGYGLAAMEGWVAYAMAGAGAMMVMTGMIGFCPMCAMVGRKLEGK